ncbi:hypothetical protein phiP47_045 [Plesiomonas phage phiP4-7]|nr:hypothetical protein phiP47_045 [Plesiomonas phage phiP4-7]
MTERESGWYRAVVRYGSWQLFEWDANEGWVTDCGLIKYHDDDFSEIDPQMVMTPSGEMVYHRSEHDPLYNTSQEG